MAARASNVHADEGREEVAGQESLVSRIVEGQVPFSMSRREETAQLPPGSSIRTVAELDGVVIGELPLKVSLQQLACSPVSPAGQVPAFENRLKSADMVDMVVAENDGLRPVTRGDAVLDGFQQEPLFVFSAGRRVQDQEAKSHPGLGTGGRARKMPLLFQTLGPWTWDPS